MRYSALAILIILIFRSNAIGQQVWLDPNSQYAAKFPTPPERADASMRDVTAHAYQSTKEYRDGAAFFAITVSLPQTLLTERNVKATMKESNRHFIESLGQRPDRAKKKWRTFADGRPRLDYEVTFSYSGVSLRGHGFWIHDRGRIMRISVTYMTSLSSQEKRRALEFLDTFVLLKK